MQCEVFNEQLVANFEICQKVNLRETCTPADVQLQFHVCNRHTNLYLSLSIASTTSRFSPRGGTPIHKLYGDVPPFRVWLFDRPLIKGVSNSKIFEDFL